MKKLRPVLTSVFLILSVISCDEPVTVVTDYVHTDGSVTRKIEMKNTKDKFAMKDIQVPYDSTWTVKDSTGFDNKGDTLWFRTAEKTFRNVEDLNLTYRNDSGANRKTVRNAYFSKKFRWFNTEYRFSERVEKTLDHGYPLGDFLNSEELHFFYSPDYLQEEKLHSADSLKYKILNDSIKAKTDRWTMKNIINEWVYYFAGLLPDHSDLSLSLDSMLSNEDRILGMCLGNSDKVDSLWSHGIILTRFIGAENAGKYKNEADSALNITLDVFSNNFRDYSVRIAMPGKLTGTNGFIDSTHLMLWPVKSDYFAAQPYEMWAESKVPNRWAWVLSGVFLVFVITGIIVRLIKKG